MMYSMKTLNGVVVVDVFKHIKAEFLEVKIMEKRNEKTNRKRNNKGV